MKLKVIGWTDYDNYDLVDYSDSNYEIEDAEYMVIYNEVRKNKYLFSGSDHQNLDTGVPVLNNGKKVLFSMREWASLMESIYDKNGTLSYMDFMTYIDYYYSDGQLPESKIPDKKFDIESFNTEYLENDHYYLDVSKELFEYAKNNNPFYIEDLINLEYIAKNDVLTLKYNSEELTVLVENVKRSSYNCNNFISTYKQVIIKHKPYKGVKYIRRPVKNDYELMTDMFNECLKEYDFYTLLDLFESKYMPYLYDYEDDENYNIDYVKNVIRRFIKDYNDIAYNKSVMNDLLILLEENK